MSEFKTIEDNKLNEYKTLLNNYKNEREILKENYHRKSKALTSKIHEIEHIITKEDGIRNKRGKYWVDYKQEQIFKLHEAEMPIEDIAKKYDTTIQSVKNAIESKYRFINRMKLRDYFKKTNGLINDSLEMDVLFFWNILSASRYKNKGINTLADYYKNTTNLTKSEINKVESAVANAQRVFKYWKEKDSKKDWSYYG